MEDELLDNLIRREYELQHFNFSAGMVTQERKQVLRRLVSEMLTKTAGKLSEIPEVLELLKKKVETITGRVLEDFEESLEYLQQLDQKNFSVPSHVLLPPDFDHLKQYDEKDEQKLDEQLEQLKTQFLQTTLMIAMLRVEHADHDAIEPFLAEEEKLHEQVEIALQDIDMPNIRKVVDATKQFVQQVEKDA